MDFTTLAFNPLCRMNEVFRYSSVHQDNPESLGEHTNEVSVMSYLIAKELIRLYSEDIDIGVLLEKCLIHDADEVITGDIPRNTKYATTAGHHELNKVAETAVMMIENSTMCGGLYDKWLDAKSGKEGVILKTVDLLCVVKKCIDEVELRGNLSFLKVAEELEKHLTSAINNPVYFSGASFKCGSLGYLMKLLNESRSEVTRVRKKYEEYINKYHIRENVIKIVED